MWRSGEAGIVPHYARLRSAGIAIVADEEHGFERNERKRDSHGPRQGHLGGRGHHLQGDQFLEDSQVGYIGGSDALPSGIPVALANHEVGAF